MVEYIKSVIFGKHHQVEETKGKTPTERIRENLERVEMKKKEKKETQDQIVFQPIKKVSPKKYERGDYIKIDTEQELSEMCEAIDKCSIIGVDLENHHVKSYDGYLCLMQITTIGEPGHISNYIIDVLLLREKIVKYLEPVFESTKIVKVFHGCLHSDISWLHRDFGMIVLNVFDT